MLLCGIIYKSRVRKAVKLDPQVKKINKEALHLLTKAAELFVEYSAKLSSDKTRSRGAKQMKHVDFINVIHTNSEFEFLQLDFPKSIIEQEKKKTASFSKASKESRKRVVDDKSVNTMNNYFTNKDS